MTSGQIDGLLVKWFGASWRTTLAGWLTVLASIAAIFASELGLAPETLAKITAAVGVITGGGLVVARDNRVSSERAGIVPKPVLRAGETVTPDMCGTTATELEDAHTLDFEVSRQKWERRHGEAWRARKADEARAQAEAEAEAKDKTGPSRWSLDKYTAWHGQPQTKPDSGKPGDERGSA
jgi:hypothetical protein